MEKLTKRFWASIGIGLGILIGAADWSIVQNALPTLQHNLGASISNLQWIMNAYGLCQTALLVTMGRLGDAFGRRRIFNLGLLIFALGCLSAGLSTTSLALIVSRGFQGIGFAMLMPTSQALLTHAFPENEHGKAMGIWATLVGVGLALGPVLGGVIISLLSWHWIFYINIPIAIVSFILVRIFVAESKNEEHRPQLDIKGMILFILALGSFIFAIIQAPDWGWKDPKILGFFGVAIALFSVFYFVEKQTDLPLIRFSFFKSLQFTAASLTIFCGCFLFWTIFFLLPLYLQNFLNEPPWVSGLVLLSVGIPFMVLSHFAGSAGDRINKRWLIPSGLLLVTITMFALTQIEASISLTGLCILLAIFGAGQAIFWSPGTSLGISTLPRSQTGVASGAITTIQETGGSVGIALAGTVFRIAEKHHYKELMLEHKLNISPEMSQKIQSLLSAPAKLQMYLSEQTSMLHHKVIALFKSSLLFGFHSGMVLAAALSFITMITVFFLLKKREDKS